MLYDVIIIGSGPAGLTAAIYTTRANLKTLVIAGEVWGGQPMMTTEVENFPGFPEGIQGPDLMANIRKQAERFGAEIVNENYTNGDLLKSPFKLSAGGKTYESKAVIIATGAKPKFLGIPGEKEKLGRGVSVCATCDAGFFRNKKVAVIGGGDVAMEEAIELSKFAADVIIFHRRDTLRASEIMQKKVRETKNIHIAFNADLMEILGENKVEKIKVKIKLSDKNLLSKSNQEIEKITPDLLRFKVLDKDEESITGEMPIDGIFLAVGYEPSSELFKRIERDERGYIVSDGVKTKIEGLFVAGDVMDKKYRQSITAASFGAMAALEAKKWLSEQK